MTAKKGCLLAGLGGIALVAIIVTLVFWFTGDAVESAESFLSLLSQGQSQTAYESTAAQFKAQTDPDAFQAFVQQLGLNRYTSASWTTRNVENNQARLEGSIATSDGGTLPLTMALVQEDRVWKILSISGPQAGVATTGSAKRIPSDEETREMASRTLADFKAAIEAGGDFGAFHETVSNLWKSQITPQGLRSAFQSLVDTKVDLGAATLGDPAFSQPPSVDGDGILHLDGYVVASGSPKLDFELKYIYEHPEWRLFGVHVLLAPSQAVESQDQASPGAEPEETLHSPSQESATAPSLPPRLPGEAFIIQENSELRGRLGRLVVEFPPGTKTGGAKIEAFRPGESAAAVSTYGKINADLLPGRYDVVVSGQRVPAVEVVSAKDTRLRVGVLRVHVGSGTKVVIHSYPAGGGEPVQITSSYGDSDFALPIGSYGVEVAGQIEIVVVEDGEIVEF